MRRAATDLKQRVSMRGWLIFLAIIAANAQTPPPLQPFDPAHYIRIIEESGEDRILLYDPNHPTSETTILRIDAGSKIVIEVDLAKMGDLPLNQLFTGAAKIN